VILRFPYLEEPLQGPPPPSLPNTAKLRWRPLVPTRVIAPSGQSLAFGRALVDPGADDTIFPLDVANVLGVALKPPTAHAMRWRGQSFPLRYGELDLELVDDDGATLRWPGIVAFTGASIRYPLLGLCGCLEFLNVHFFGADYRIEIEPNTSFPASGGP
jgi:hypothetical protein